jgi:sulfite reductase (NADPH) flavoprotein alpha-component
MEAFVTATPLLPRNAPFLPEDIETLNSVVARTTPLQRSWLAGFFAGFEAAQGGAAQPLPVAAAKPRAGLTVLYGSESGNSEALALKTKKLAQKHGLDARVFDMADVDLSVLSKTKNLIVFVATWGEGDPPGRAVDFYAALMRDDAPRLDKDIRFAVLALGDTAYTQFCAVGKAIDARLEMLGATRAVDRIDLDLDFAKKAAEWTESALGELAPKDADNATVVHVDFKGGAQLSDDEPLYTAENPLQAEIAQLTNLNGTGSTRETWHVEIAADAPGFSYLPGDSIGILPDNDPALALAVAEATGLGADGDVVKKLRESYDVTTLSRSLIEAYAKLTGRTDVAKLADPKAFASFAADRQLVDLFETYPEKLKPAQLYGLLRALPGRLYSVASSLAAHPGEAHVLVGAVRWESHGRKRQGVASTYLADRRRMGDPVNIYVKPNRHFRLPEDKARPIVMIGAGTGVAPYRAFIEERIEQGSKGKSWLVFGERNYTNDFLYQLEWQEYIESGALSRIDVAFSRDQPEKIYVQQRLWEHRTELLRWVEEGAHIYVCGDEKGMARDVDVMLGRILAEAARGDDEAGRAKLKELTKAGRYQRDVY